MRVSPSAPQGSERVGVWLYGARGSVGATAITGLLALQRDAVPATGCVTGRRPFSDCRLPQWDAMVVGGHDIVDTPLTERADALALGGVIPREVVAAVREDLLAVDAEVRTGFHPASNDATLADAAHRLATDIADFRWRHELDRVVVINVSSTEPPHPDCPQHADPDALVAALADPSLSVLPPSSVCAYAAIQAGCGFVDFTPSCGFRIPALIALADRQKVPLAGSDGKTGETLLRSVLAPMFDARALRVRSWAGVNLLGGGDGANLEDPDKVKSKLSAKGAVLTALLGEEVTAPLHIDNVPDLGDRKTSWDHVSFEGFLGIQMSAQVTWCGVDSTLAAPLVLDLARLVLAAHQRGLSGPLPELGFFFKDPVGTSEHSFAEQTRILHKWAEGLDGLALGAGADGALAARS